MEEREEEKEERWAASLQPVWTQEPKNLVWEEKQEEKALASLLAGDSGGTRATAAASPLPRPSHSPPLKQASGSPLGCRDSGGEAAFSSSRVLRGHFEFCSP